MFILQVLGFQVEATRPAPPTSHCPWHPIDMNVACAAFAACQTTETIAQKDSASHLSAKQRPSKDSGLLEMEVSTGNAAWEGRVLKGLGRMTSIH